VKKMNKSIAKSCQLTHVHGHQPTQAMTSLINSCSGTEVPCQNRASGINAMLFLLQCGMVLSRFVHGNMLRISSGGHQPKLARKNDQFLESIASMV
jgi:hypothetical protein